MAVAAPLLARVMILIVFHMCIYMCVQGWCEWADLPGASLARVLYLLTGAEVSLPHVSTIIPSWNMCFVMIQRPAHPFTNLRIAPATAALLGCPLPMLFPPTFFLLCFFWHCGLFNVTSVVMIMFTNCIRLWLYSFVLALASGLQRLLCSVFYNALVSYILHVC